MKMMTDYMSEARFGKQRETTPWEYECHAHLAMDGVNYSEAMARHASGANESIVRSELECYRAHGVRFLRDGGDKYGVSHLGKAIAGEFGIEYLSPIFAIHKEGHYGGIVGRSFTSMRGFASLVEEAAGLGADFIKIMTTGIMDFDVFGRIVVGEALKADEVREMVHIAHESGFAVMSHTNGSRAVYEACEAGVDSIEHGNYLDEDAIAALAQSGTCFVPTMAVAHDLLSMGLYDSSTLEQICESERCSVARAYQLGARIAVGSDAGAVGVAHGKGAQDELSCLLDALGDTHETRAYLLAGCKWLFERFKRA